MRLPEELRNMLRDMLAQAEAMADGATELMGRRFTSEAADGGVTATVTGAMTLDGVVISRQAVRQFDNLSLGDAVTEAINAAEATARTAHRDLVDQASVGGVKISDVIADPLRLTREFPTGERPG